MILQPFREPTNTISIALPPAENIEPKIIILIAKSIESLTREIK